MIPFKVGNLFPNRNKFALCYRVLFLLLLLSQISKETNDIAKKLTILQHSD